MQFKEDIPFLISLFFLVLHHVLYEGLAAAHFLRKKAVASSRNEQRRKKKMENGKRKPFCRAKDFLIVIAP